MRDLGLQKERTALSWRRTGLSLLTISALTARIGLAGNHYLICLAALALCLGSTWMTLKSNVRIHELSFHACSGPSASFVWRVYLITIFLIILSGLAVIF